MTCCRAGFLRGEVGLASGWAVGRRSGIVALAANTRPALGLAAGLLVLAACRALASASPSEPTGFCDGVFAAAVGAVWGLLIGDAAGRLGDGLGAAAVVLAARSDPGAVAALAVVLASGGGGLAIGGGGLPLGGGGASVAGAAAEVVALVVARSGAGISSAAALATVVGSGGGGSAACSPAAGFAAAADPGCEGGDGRSADARLLPRCWCAGS